MTDNQGMLPPAGWYPDPFGAPHERWWDGTQWTDHTNVPAPPAAPAYVPPTYVEPTPVEPVVEQPAYEQPTYQQPSYEQPTYQQPTYEQPAYEQPSFEQPSYEQPSYEESKYEPSAYQEPAAYTPPAYSEPAFTEPSYSEPTVTEPAYREPDHAFEFGLLVSGRDGAAATASGSSSDDGFGDWAGSEYVEPVRNTPATAGLTFGILSFLLPVLGGALGLVFSVIGLNRAGQLDKSGEGPVGRGKSIAGIVLSIIGSAASVAFLIFGLPGVLASLQAAPLIPDTSDQSVDGTQLTANGNIPLAVGATGTFTPDGADAPSIQFTVTDISVDTSCTTVVPDNGQFLAVTMELTTAADYQTTTTGGGSLHVNASDWTTYLPDGNLIVNTDNGTECVAEDKQFPLEIAPGSTVTGTIFVDTSAETTAMSWTASEVVTEDPASARWEWAIPRA